MPQQRRKPTDQEKQAIQTVLYDLERWDGFEVGFLHKSFNQLQEANRDNCMVWLTAPEPAQKLWIELCKAKTENDRDRVTQLSLRLKDELLSWLEIGVPDLSQDAKEKIRKYKEEKECEYALDRRIYAVRSQLEKDVESGDESRLVAIESFLQSEKESKSATRPRLTEEEREKVYRAIKKTMNPTATVSKDGQQITKEEWKTVKEDLKREVVIKRLKEKIRQVEFTDEGWEDYLRLHYVFAELLFDRAKKEAKSDKMDVGDVRRAAYSLFSFVNLH